MFGNPEKRLEKKILFFQEVPYITLFILYGFIIIRFKSMNILFCRHSKRALKNKMYMRFGQKLIN